MYAFTHILQLRVFLLYLYYTHSMYNWVYLQFCEAHYYGNQTTTPIITVKE